MTIESKSTQAPTYKRTESPSEGTIALIAALAVHTGKITAQTMKTNNADNFLTLLLKLDRVYAGKTLHVFVDNLTIPKNKKLKEC